MCAAVERSDRHACLAAGCDVRPDPAAPRHRPLDRAGALPERPAAGRTAAGRSGCAAFFGRQLQCGADPPPGRCGRPDGRAGCRSDEGTGLARTAAHAGVPFALIVAALAGRQKTPRRRRARCRFAQSPAERVARKRARCAHAMALRVAVAAFQRHAGTAALERRSRRRGVSAEGTQARQRWRGPAAFVEAHAQRARTGAVGAGRAEIVRMSVVEVFTDGACLGNPGPGGWAALLRFGAHEKLLAGGERATTNNRMELYAAIAALEALTRACKIELSTDSQYLRQGIEEWLPRWRANGWRTVGKKPVKNQDLWERLAAAAARHEISWRWVRGHSGHVENEIVDRAAREQAGRFREEQAL